MLDRRRIERLARRVAGAAGWRVRRLEWAARAPLHVLAYHRVAAPAVDPWELAVPPEIFDAQLGALRRRGDVVGLDDGLARRRGGLTRRPCFALTFDDAYVDVLDDAVPLLERHDAPATVFVATGFLGAPSFWWDRLAALVLGDLAPVPALVDAFAAAVQPWPGGEALRDGGDDRADLHLRAYDALPGLTPAEVDAIVDRVLAHLGVDLPPVDGRPMTVDELTALAGHPLVTIGAHTVDHRFLTQLPATTVHDEIARGNRELDEILGPARRVLAYPHGDANRAVEAAARRAGVRRALTTDDRPVSVFDRDLRLPRRHATARYDADAFEAWLATT